MIHQITIATVEKNCSKLYASRLKDLLMYFTNDMQKSLPVLRSGIILFKSNRFYSIP